MSAVQSSPLVQMLMAHMTQQALTPPASTPAAVAPAPRAKAAPKMSEFGKVLSGLNTAFGGSPTDQSHTALMGFLSALGAQSGPHMLTPVPLTEAVSKAALQAPNYQQQAAGSQITQEAALPFQVTRTQEVQQAFRDATNPSLTPQQRSAAAYKVDSLMGWNAASDPAVAQRLAQIKAQYQPVTQGPGATLTTAANVAQGAGANEHGAPPEGSYGNPAVGLSQTPGVPGLVASTAANKAGAAAYATAPVQAALHPIMYQVGKQQVQRPQVPGQFVPVPAVPPGAAQAARAAAMQRMIGTQAGLTAAAQGAGRPAPVAPTPGAPTGPGVMAQGLAPAQLALTQAQGTQAAASNAAYQKQAEDAKDILAQVQGLTQAAHNFAPGQFADARVKGLQWMQSLGLITPAEMNRLGSAQEGAKMTIQLQSAFTRSLGSREAAQVFSTLGRGVPNLTMSPDGFAKVSAYMEGMAKYNIARAEMAQHMFNQTNVRGLNNVRDLFLKNSNPAYYIIGSAPPTIQREMIAAMGSKARPFVERWYQAAVKGYAPMLGQPGAP